MRRFKQDQIKFRFYINLPSGDFNLHFAVFNSTAPTSFAGQTWQLLIYGRLSEGSQLTLLLSFERENAQCGEACATGLLRPTPDIAARSPAHSWLYVSARCSITFEITTQLWIFCWEQCCAKHSSFRRNEFCAR